MTRRPTEDDLRRADSQMIAAGVGALLGFVLLLILLVLTVPPA